MKNVLLYALVALMAVSCRTKPPRPPALSPTGAANSFFVLPSFPMVTLSWTNQPMSNLVVNVRESSDPFTDPSGWITVGNVTGINAIIVPMLPAQNFFSASVVAQTMTLAWDYPADEISPGLSFNFYWQPDGASQWTFLTNVPPDNLMARLQVTAPSGRFALTATNSELQAESDFSNIVPWTSRVGELVPLKIKLR